MRSSPASAVLWLRAAAAYNLAWGAWVVLLPGHYFDLVGMAPPRYPELWQCIGMIVGVYGIGYAIAARDPLRHWPIVFVGLVGKILGPIGFGWAIAKGSLPWDFGWILLTNDFLWWIPFSWILWRSFVASTAPVVVDSPVETSDRDSLVRWRRSSHGRTLADHFDEAPHLVVFTRHFGCTFCREALAELGRRRARIEEEGTRLLVVHMGSPEQGEAILARYGLAGVAHVSDPAAVLYRAFELERGRFRQLFGWKSWWRGARAGLLDRHGVGRLVGDGLQMPGVFLVQGERIVREYRHRSAADRPDYVSLAACPLPPAGGAR